ncbi:MAG: hypothetical protein JST90_12090 [Bacteroidetes bacterium]|nr:hypothetical protein [Bacteroidota bacterium]
MQDSKLHLLLSRFSAYELNRLDKFMRSPYLNDDEVLTRLYGYLLPFYKNPLAGIPEKNKLWKAVYPRIPFTNLKYARLLSDLFRKVEYFVAIEKLKQKPTEENILILETYNELRMSKHFTEPSLSAQNKLTRNPERDSDYHLQSFRLSVQQYAFLENKKQRGTNKNLQDTIYHLDSFYLINKLRYTAASLHYGQFLSVRQDSALLGEILIWLRAHPPTRDPAIAAYHYIILSLTEPEEERHFRDLKKLLLSDSAALAISTKLDAVDHALNYCIRKINTGHTSYQSEIFSLYKYALDHELLYDKGILSPWDYKNITTIALRNKEYKWTASFLETYKYKLAKPEQKNAYTFNQARYHFAMKQYDRVLDLLQGVEYTDIFYLLDSKTTLMKTYYELGEYQPLQSLKESFRILLRRKKLISEQNRANYGNFARLVMKLYRIDVRDKAKLAALRKEIEETGNTADRTWILEKLHELG